MTIRKTEQHLLVRSYSRCKFITEQYEAHWTNLFNGKWGHKS